MFMDGGRPGDKDTAVCNSRSPLLPRDSPRCLELDESTLAGVENLCVEVGLGEGDAAGVDAVCPKGDEPAQGCNSSSLGHCNRVGRKKKKCDRLGKKVGSKIESPPPNPRSPFRTRSAQATRRKWGRAEGGHAKPTVGQCLSAPACSTAGMEEIPRFEWLRGRHRRCFACARDPSRLLFPRLRRCMVRSAAHSCETPPPAQRCEPCQ